MKRKLRLKIWIAVIIIVSGIFIFAIIWQKRPDTNENRNDSSFEVTMAPVILHEFLNEINAVGTLNAHETVLLNPKVSGNVEFVLVDIGDRVDANHVVIRLDRTNFELAVKQTKAALDAAEAAHGQAKAQFEWSEKELDRYSNLLAERVIPQNRFDATEAAYKIAREALTAAKERYNQAKAVFEITQEHLKDADIRSPVTGIVVERQVEVGQFVSTAVQVLRIVDQTSLKVDVDLPEMDFSRAVVGIPVVIIVDAFPEKKFQGKVTVVNPMVKCETRTFRVRAEVPNPSGELVDGMFARVQLLVGKRTALAIPRDALRCLPGSGTYYVFVLDGNKALKQTVKIGVIGDQYAEVLDGLAEDEKVVTSGTGRLRSGMEVAIFQGTTKELKDADKENMK